MSLAIAFNSWDAPDDGGYVRMAFASVAGSTVALLIVLALFIERVARKASAASIAVYGAIAVVVIAYQVQLLASAAELLLWRLSLPS
jgi:hypothetical protein